ncbi:DNA-directed RNA polymerase, beta' subunit [Thermocrinis albus DSM 14484]|uniref:DNA-directed RNA polymerase subunit beta' n=1 Tax=Thermocrinis albus (strain DSM 14484 / JCM 11386 / HI 11/12) TaxID=638303 RepID=D3SQ21_THEAH|nr:DNA-directed RNA polymerase subunit beta' [Thermocrinis albus]ADC89258.1 DNA-directed RNA polymerase, beta' subunit [Thermocrinis albus DSM 14484]
MKRKGLLPFERIKLMLASPEEIRSWSYGEVKKPETINYRTHKPEKEGLFCAKIFGPIKDYECLCGKYRGKRYEGTICEKCGVEVTRSYVRRERFGHIELAAPVVHIWFLKSSPSKIGTLLGLSVRDVERVIYFENYLVIEYPTTEEEERDFREAEDTIPLKDDMGNTKFVKLHVVDEDTYMEVYAPNLEHKFEGGMGAEMIKKVLASLDLEAYAQKLREEVKPYSFSYEDMGKQLEGRYKKIYHRMVKVLADDLRLYGVPLEYPEELTLEQALLGILNEELYLNVKTGKVVEEDCGEDCMTGKEAIQVYYENLRQTKKDLPIFERIKEDIRQAVLKEVSEARIKKQLRVLKLVESFIKSGNRPEWMVLEVLPVLPPELRPLVPLEGGRFATSDLNDLYRRIINRNNRLKRLIELDAPDIIIRNEKRMLQEVVNALIDNGKGGRVVTQNGRPLKSLADYLKGKQGRFRQNLLGKRVDYSGRSVIVVGPELQMHQCGLPRIMALELFKPFVIRRLEEKGYATSIKHAKKLIEQKTPEVWECLEEVVKQHPVLLNRAPTLHRPSIQAFEPVLIDGKAIQLHPLVCPPFNADFDGDQMAVHVPLGIMAQLEAYILMLSTQNILSPAHGKPITMPSQDIILGLYYITQEVPGVQGEGKLFLSKEDVLLALENQKVDIHAKIKLRLENGKVIETTPGRVLFNTILPEGYPFVNDPLDKKKVSKLVSDVYKRYGVERTAKFLDDLKDLGFRMATKAAVSIGIDDLQVPAVKKEIIQEAFRQTDEIADLYKKGVLTAKERYNRIIDLWSEITDRVSRAMFEEIEKSTRKEGDKTYPGIFNPIYMMANSGARGNRDQIRQLAAMRGLMAKHTGEFIETPIVANFREGLTVLEYFISTYGARKGLADTALKTAFAGYLTRRLVDVAQDIMITERDCNTTKGIEMTAIVEGGEEKVPLKDRIVGRTLAEDVIDPYTGEVIATRNTVVDEELADRIVHAGIEKVKVRSPLTCEAKFGICSMCYGWDLSQRKLVDIGEAVGIIAAQSIGEPGTQLTMRTFHIGGAAIAERAKGELVNESEGYVKYYNIKLIKNREGKWVNISKDGAIGIVDAEGRMLERHAVPYAAHILVEEGKKVPAGTTLAEWDPFNTYIIAEEGGKVEFKDIALDITVKEERDPFTGKTSTVVSFTRPKDAMLHTPRIVVTTPDGREVVYDLPVNSIISIPAEKLQTEWYVCPTCTESEGAEIQHRYYVVKDYYVEPGDVLARIPKEIAKVRDIVGGLPRVEELFEARRPKNPAVLSEIDGIVRIYEDADEVILFNPKTGETRKYSIKKDEYILVTHGQFIQKGARITDSLVADIDGQVRIKGRGYKVVVYNKETGLQREYFVPKGKHLLVKNGDVVQAGDPLTDGTPVPEEILRIKGVEELQKFLLKEVQMVYRLQGVDINDKHFEVIIRQMLRKRRVVDPGDSRFLVNEEVDIEELDEEIKRIQEEGGKIPKVEPILVGISKAALSSRSWISAASFQETTKVLTDAACEGKVDDLRGIKENVIIGNIIPAGTGVMEYSHVDVQEQKVRTGKDVV